MRDSVGAALGPVRLYALPGQNGHFDPHITIAYADRRMPADPVREALDAVAPLDFELAISGCSLVGLRRTKPVWHWSSALRVPIGAPARELERLSR